MSLFFDHKPKKESDPTKLDEVQKWFQSQEDFTTHDYKQGYFFGIPERETSFNDSFECALFLAENGHYTQAMVLLRTALNTVLATTMKQIVTSIPNRVKESEYLKGMFVNLEELDFSQSRSGVGGRFEFTQSQHSMNIPAALRELIDLRFITETIIESQFIQEENKKYSLWDSKYKLATWILNGHVHAHDSIVDRFRSEEENSVVKKEREFSADLWNEFQSVAFAILDLKLCITKSLYKSIVNLIFKKHIPANLTARIEVLKHTQYIPNFSAGNGKGWLKICICCKTRPLRNQKLENKDYVCGTCKSTSGSD